MTQLLIKRNKKSENVLNEMSVSSVFRIANREGIYMRVKTPDYFMNSSIFQDRYGRGDILVLNLSFGTLSFASSNEPCYPCKSATLDVIE
jgi:hypothetical protein